MSQTRSMPSVREHGVINVNSIDYQFLIRKSVSESDRETYEAVRQQMESKPKREERRRIGFVTGQ